MRALSSLRRRLLWVTSFAAVAILLGYGVGVRMPLQDVDTAGFMELVSGQRDDVLQRPLDSQYFSGVTYGLSLYGVDGETACKAMPTANSREASVMPGHPYLLAIPLAVISLVTGISGRWIGATAWSISVSIGIFALLHFLRRAQLSTSLQVSFLVTVGIFPPLVLSLLGQAYFDKLLFGPAIYLLLQVHSFIKFSQFQLLPSLLSVLAMALVSERGALLAGFISIFPCILHPRSPKYIVSKFAWILGAGSLSLVWVLIWQRNFEDSSLNDFATSEIIPNLLESLKSVADQPYRSFLVVLCPLLLLSIVAGRWIAMVLIAIVPNLGIPLGILNILNFSAHYHQIMIPVLVGVAAIGLANLSTLCQRSRHVTSCLTPTTTPDQVIAISLIVVSLLCWSNYGTGSSPDPLRNAVEVALPVISDDFQQKNIASANILRFTGELSYFADKDTTISAPGHFAPALQVAGFKDFVSFPGALGEADYVLLPSIGGSTVVMPHADPQGIRQPLEECVTDVIVERYLLVKNFGNYSGTDLFLFKLKQD